MPSKTDTTGAPAPGRAGPAPTPRPGPAALSSHGLTRRLRLLPGAGLARVAPKVGATQRGPALCRGWGRQCQEGGDGAGPPGRWATVRGPAGPGCSEGGQPRRQHGGPEVPQAGPREARQPQFPHPSQGRGRPCPTGQQARPPGPRRGAGWPGALRKGREGEGRAGWGASLRSAWARVRFRNSPGRPKKSRPRSCHWPCSGGCICPHPVLPAPPPS